MMVETILESSQDFGMSGGALPQWKRELLQRRAARSRPPPPAPPPPPPPPRDDDEEDELRYGPGIVKRLKSRYLSLALRDAPRRRPSVLRRATSLEQLLDERPPPAPRAAPAPRPAARAPRPHSALVAAPAVAQPAPRRDAVKRARSVDALSRLEPRDEPPPPPRPSARPPRRPAPLLRDAERPPPDVVRSTLRKFEPAPVRRAAPAARVSAALRGLERGPTPPPESPPPAAPPEPRSPSPGGPAPTAAEEVPAAGSRAVSRAALDGIARAGCSTRYAFEAPRRGSHLPPLAATNPVLLGRARRVGVIRPMPAPPLERALSAPVPPAEEINDKSEEPLCSPPPREAPPSALVEPIPRSPPEEAPPQARLRSPDPPPAKPDSPIFKPDPPTIKADPPSYKVESPVAKAEPPTPKIERPEPKLEKLDKQEKQQDKVEKGPALTNGVSERAAWGALRPRPAAATTVVFNFSHRKEVPDYIENDGLVLRASRRDRIKPGEPGVVVLRPEALVLTGSDDEGDGADGDGGPPSPCDVRFFNDNVLINGRSSMPVRRDRDRQARLKLQFDDSLTRTFEYPSETSLCLDSDDECPMTPNSAPTAPNTAPAPHHAASTLAANTHIASAALARYTPSKTCSDAFQLGVTRRPQPQDTVPEKCVGENGDVGDGGAVPAEPAEGEGGGGDARPCAADAARSWSDSRTLATDLLF